MRLAALHQLRLLDTAPEDVYDDLALLAAQICGTPIALVSLVDERRQWFKARVGLAATETHRDLAFCAHAIETPDALFMVADTLDDARFRDNALVTGDPRIRFYAGAPIVVRSGAAVGTVCVTDTRPRELSPAQQNALRALARQAAALLDLRERTAAAEALQESLDEEIARRRLLLMNASDGIVVHREDFSIAEASVSFSRMLGYSPAESMDLRPWDWDVHLDTRAKVMAQGRRFDSGKTFLDTVWRRKDGSEIDVEIVYSRIDTKQGRESLLVCRDVTERKRAVRELRRLTDLSARMGTLAQVGGWDLDLRTNAFTWTAEVYAIHDLDTSAPLELTRNIDYYAPEARPIIRGAVQAAIDHGTPWDLELPFITAKGRHLWVRAQGASVREDGRAIRLFGAFQDITVRKHAEQALLASERRLRTIADNLPAVVTHVDAAGCYRFVNAAAGRVFGVAPETMLGRTLREVHGARFHDKISPHVAALRRGEAVSFQGSGLVQGQSYHYQASCIPDRDSSGAVQGFYAMSFDITALKETQRLLEAQATIDALTGLPNRRQLEEKLREAMSRTQRSERLLAVMFLDLDNFKQINDSLGHAAGDRVLQDVAARLQRSVRTTDVVARLAGDEFVVLLEGIEDDAAVRRVAEKILDALGPPVLVDGACVQATASIGIAGYGGDSSQDAGPLSPAQLLADADRALYASKARGRNQFYFAERRFRA